MTRRRADKGDQPAGETVVHHLALDRFEEDRDGASLAVLVTVDGHSIVVPRAILPPDAAAGTTLTVTLALDPKATAEVARNITALRADLKKTDPGGTIHL